MSILTFLLSQWRSHFDYQFYLLQMMDSGSPLEVINRRENTFSDLEIANLHPYIIIL